MTSLSIANGGDQRTSRAGRTWKRLSAGDRTVIALFLMVVVIAVAGPWLAPYPTMSANSSQRLLPPSTLHWFGTDENGMDVFSRLVAAPRTDVTIALVATLLSVLIGAPLGVLTGFFNPVRVESCRYLQRACFAFSMSYNPFPSSSWPWSSSQSEAPERKTSSWLSPS